MTPRTLVSFHAHPDDEALLCAGTLARAAAEGHRVVLVVATAGEAGLAAEHYSASLGAARTAELKRSAQALGCARVVCLGYADSGMAGAPSGHPDSFARADPELAARRLADILVEESADVLTTYDPAGGYGHPDHVAVHRVGARAAELAGEQLTTAPAVLQATVDRRLLLRALRVLAAVRVLGRIVPALALPPDFDPARFQDAYTASEQLTHRIDVRRYSMAKRAAMRAHASQASTPGTPGGPGGPGGDFGGRTLATFLRLPGPLFRLAFGHEWFVAAGVRPVRPVLDDVFTTDRGRV